MKASETRLQQIIEGTKQYYVPLFQRAYSWEKREWSMLWQDLTDLLEDPSLPYHFIGSIVTMQTSSTPQSVPQYLLIDGQQRLTTIFILLTLIRDKARLLEAEELADSIHEQLLVNKFRKSIEHYRLLPTQADRNTFCQLIDHKEVARTGGKAN